MKSITAQLIDAAAESFPMRGPIYEFGFSPVYEAGGPSPDGGREPDGPDEPTRIDRLEDLDRLPFPDAAAGTVVCENALQYVFDPARTIGEMARVLAPGGLLVVVESTRPAALGVGNRYWTIHPSAMGRLTSRLNGTLIGWVGEDETPTMVFGIGCKSPMPAEFARGVQPFLDRLARRLAEPAASRRVLRRLARRLIGRVHWPGRRASGDAHRVQYALHLPVDEQSRPAILDSCLPPANTSMRMDLNG